MEKTSILFLTIWLLLAIVLYSSGSDLKTTNDLDEISESESTNLINRHLSDDQEEEDDDDDTHWNKGETRAHGRHRCGKKGQKCSKGQVCRRKCQSKCVRQSPAHADSTTQCTGDDWPDKSLCQPLDHCCELDDKISCCNVTDTSGDTPRLGKGYCHPTSKTCKVEYEADCHGGEKIFPGDKCEQIDGQPTPCCQDYECKQAEGDTMPRCTPK